MNYQELCNQHQKEAEEYTDGKLFFAFGSTKEEVTQKLYNDYGVTPEKVTGIGAGGYVLTEFLPDLNKFLLKQADEKKEYTLANIYEVVLYELWNYEIYISLDYDLYGLCSEILDLTDDEIQANKDEINRAWRDYKREFEKLNI